MGPTGDTEPPRAPRRRRRLPLHERNVVKSAVATATVVGAAAAVVGTVLAVSAGETTGESARDHVRLEVAEQTLEERPACVVSAADPWVGPVPGALKASGAAALRV